MLPLGLEKLSAQQGRRDGITQTPSKRQEGLYFQQFSLGSGSMAYAMRSPLKRSMSGSFTRSLYLLPLS
jgi:hypothetical protein